jgi:hypothetical protein
MIFLFLLAFYRQHLLAYLTFSVYTVKKHNALHMAPIILPIATWTIKKFPANAWDMWIMIDYWGTDEPLCDIGPTPFGDGIVDVQDLIVLSEHLFEEVPPVE